MTRTNSAGQRIGDAVPGWIARPFPPGATLAGSRCTVTPLLPQHDEDLAVVFGAMADQDWTYLPLHRPDDLAQARQVIDAVRALPCALPYVILVDGTPQGMLSLMRIDPDNGIAEIGWVVIGAGIRRTPVSTQAQRLLMGHVFDDLGYRRLEWKCDALNEPSRRAALRLGYTLEGTFRQAVVTKGRNRDTTMFSLLDGEWPARRALLDAWLAPENFDAAGRQRTSLHAPASPPE